MTTQITRRFFVLSQDAHLLPDVLLGEDLRLLPPRPGPGLRSLLHGHHALHAAQPGALGHPGSVHRLRDLRRAAFDRQLLRCESRALPIVSQSWLTVLIPTVDQASLAEGQ